MAVAAEIVKERADMFDWEFAEAQFVPAEFPEPIEYLPPPEAEIYGRSLGTIRRLGKLMIRATTAEVIASPEAAQAKAEFYTSVEEGFGTDIELGGGLEVRDFDRRPIISGKVMAKDLKTAISDMTKAGLACAEETAKKDARFLPQLTRSKWDDKNALIVDKMARRETNYNTRIVASPYVEEAAAQSGGEYWRNIGYVPRFRRGFVQLYHVSGDEVITGSLSFDGSDKQRLRKIFQRYGQKIPEGESTDNWLKYAITANLTEEQAKAMALEIADAAADLHYKKNTNTIDVTKQHKALMERVFNESYIHIGESLIKGRQTDGAQKLIHQLADKAQHFNAHYAQALYKMRADKHRFTDEDSIVLHELIVYSTIEMMRALSLERTKTDQHPAQTTNKQTRVLAGQLEALDTSMFQNILGGFGADGARNNRTYSACGLSISLGEDAAPDSPQSAFAGYDRNSKADTDKLGDRWFTCPKGHLNYRRFANVKEKTCSKCGIDISCSKPKTPAKPHAATNIRHILFSETGIIEKSSYALAA